MREKARPLLTGRYFAQPGRDLSARVASTLLLMELAAAANGFNSQNAECPAAVLGNEIEAGSWAARIVAARVDRGQARQADGGTIGIAERLVCRRIAGSGLLKR